MTIRKTCQIAVLLASSMTMTACATNAPTESDVSESTDMKFQIDPDWPDPVTRVDTNWSIIEKDGQNYMATPYQEFLKYMRYQEGLIRYIKQANQIICFYRQDLYEQRCKRYNSESDSGDGNDDG